MHLDGFPRRQIGIQGPEKQQDGKLERSAYEAVIQVPAAVKGNKR